MFNKNNLIHHKRICGYFVEQKSHQCKICEKMFYSSNELSSHLFICYECSVGRAQPREGPAKAVATYLKPGSTFMTSQPQYQS